MRRKIVVGQGFPIGEDRHAQLWRKEFQLILEPLRVARIGGDDRGDAAGGHLLQRELRQQQGIG